MGKVALAALLLGPLLFTGTVACSRKPATAPVVAAPEAEEEPLLVRIRSTERTNGGSALHVLVRKTTSRDYNIAEDYDRIAASLSEGVDPQTLQWGIVLPGTLLELQVPRPVEGNVGVYFLFSQPGPRWRYLVNEASPTLLEVDLAVDHISAVRVSKDEE